MADIFPLQGLHYNSKQVSISDVISPPYDVISESEGKRLLDQSPYNFAHIVLAKDNADDYKDVKKKLIQWEKSQVLVRDSKPSYYIYQQCFQLGDKEFRRNTLLCAVKLSEFSDRIILPHEQTHSKPREDRLNILRHTQCNLSPIFAVVQDKENVLSNCFQSFLFEEPILKGATRDGVKHAVWAFTPEAAPQIQSFFKDQALYIVDGHHRYGSALAYAKELGVLGQSDPPAASALFAIGNTFDPALQVFSTHRLVRSAALGVDALEKLKMEYDVSVISSDEALKEFLTQPSANPSFVIDFKAQRFLCVPKNWQEKSKEWGSSVAKLSVAWSDKKFLPEYLDVQDGARGDRIQYAKDPETLWEAQGPEDLLVLFPPIDAHSITDVADQDKYMPQKSTYFYPKVSAGLVVRPFDSEDSPS